MNAIYIFGTFIPWINECWYNPLCYYLQKRLFQNVIFLFAIKKFGQWYMKAWSPPYQSLIFHIYSIYILRLRIYNDYRRYAEYLYSIRPWLGFDMDSVGSRLDKQFSDQYLINTSGSIGIIIGMRLTFVVYSLYLWWEYWLIL